MANHLARHHRQGVVFRACMMNCITGTRKVVTHNKFYSYDPQKKTAVPQHTGSEQALGGLCEILRWSPPPPVRKRPRAASLASSADALAQAVEAQAQAQADVCVQPVEAQAQAQADVCLRLGSVDDLVLRALAAGHVAVVKGADGVTATLLPARP